MDDNDTKSIACLNPKLFISSLWHSHKWSALLSHHWHVLAIPKIQDIMFWHPSVFWNYTNYLSSTLFKHFNSESIIRSWDGHALLLLSATYVSYNYHPDKQSHSALHMYALTYHTHTAQELVAAGLWCLNSLVFSISFNCCANRLPTMICLQETHLCYSKLYISY